MVKSAVARRYAKALFDLVDKQSIDPTRTSLNGLGQALSESGPLQHAMTSPAFSEENKFSVLVELAARLGSPPVVKNFLDQLVKKNRVSFLPDIADRFGKLVDESKGTEQVIVSSAAPLGASEQERIRTRLQQVMKREATVTFETDPSQVAGLRIRLGSTVMDSTVRGRLTAMQRLLTKE